MFRIYLTSRAEKVFGELSDGLRQKFYEEFERLKVNPSTNPKVKKIQGTEYGYRLRLGRWRILFTLFLDKKRIEVVDIFLKKGKEDYLRKRKLIY